MPEPSKRTCWRGSASRSKIRDGVAAMNRVTDIDRDDDISCSVGWGVDATDRIDDVLQRTS